MTWSVKCAAVCDMRLACMAPSLIGPDLPLAEPSEACALTALTALMPQHRHVVDRVGTDAMLIAHASAGRTPSARLSVRLTLAVLFWGCAVAILCRRRHFLGRLEACLLGVEPLST